MIQPGIYPSDQLSNEDYHADDALGHSGAVTIMEQSPAHFLWERTHPAEQKREFDIGTAVHCALLEPEYFNDRMFVLPVEFKDYRKKDAQALREHAYLRDMTPLLGDQFSAVTVMAEAVRAHPIAGPLLTGGIAEQSLFWRDETNGVMRKCRPDYRVDRAKNRSDDAWIINLKTAASAHPEAIRRVAWDNHWWSSQAYTMEGLAAHGIEVSDYLYIVVEKDQPHYVVVYRLPERAVEMGMLFNQKAVNTFAWCQRTGDWPGYAQTIVDIEPFAWQETRFEERHVRGDFEIKPGFWS